MATFAQELQALANAAGEIVIVGVRRRDKGWFINSGNWEVDLPTPHAAVSSLRAELGRRLETLRRDERRTAAQIARLEGALGVSAGVPS
jgi:hypothetical protein